MRDEDRPDRPVTPGAPEWLQRWQNSPLPPEQALAIFDGLGAVKPDEMLGRWRGTGLHTGHPLDGLLEAYGWYGKAFRGPDDVDPLLFRIGHGDPFAVDPARLPVSLGRRLPRLAHNPLGPVAFRLASPLLRTSRSAARLRLVEHRGGPSAAMIYDSQPITDHFRRIDPSRLLGLMDLRGDPRPFFFMLERERPAVPAAARGESRSSRG